ncbi:hypothetical protein [Gordonia sp. SID5947]|nr:hypothetical protein [Gordonia sp. SID5947]
MPVRADEARRTWGAENNIYRLGHRDVQHVDGTGAGWDVPAIVRAR